ncbi:MAG: SurA N-terminal domain-containing protein [Pyrinomonadaceae bacterium]
MQKFKSGYISVAVLAALAAILSACGGGVGPSNSSSGGVDPNETAASVNGKVIKMEDVERGVKQQAQGQDVRLSPLELAQARLQILDGLIQQEVMFQKAEAEGTVPSPDDVTVEFNKRKTASGLSAEQFDAKMKEIGETEASAREAIKKGLAIQKLTDKITGKIEPPKDSEIDAFYAGNKEAFVKKRGVRLAAIVIDPANNGQGDTTVDEQSAVLKGNEIIKQLQSGVDFATIARDKSEDQSRLQSGDLGNISEEQMKQTFPPQVAATLMNPNFKVGQIIPTPMQGKFYILKLQERNDQDENLNLESPGVRQRVTDELINARKQLLAAAYQAIAMDDAKIENYLAKKVIEHPNELSGARPAGIATPAATNVNANAAANSNVVSNSAAASNLPTNTAPLANSAINGNAANTAK